MRKSLTTVKVKTINLLALCVLVVISMPVDTYAFDAKDVPILMYHKLDEITPTIYWVSDTDFRDQLFLLKDLGYQTVDFEDLYAHFTGVAQLPAKPVIVTFDDGYEDIYTHALPVLQEFSDVGFFGVAHITTDWIADDEQSRRNNDWDSYPNGPEPVTPHMIWPEVRVLYDAGWAIEAHSRTHDSTSDAGYDAVYEAGSSVVIGQKIAIPDPNFYCYPFGQYTTALINALQYPENNCLGAMNASGGIENTATMDIWHIKRIGIMRDDDLDDFASKIGESVPDLPTLEVYTVGSGSVEVNPDQPYYRGDPDVTLTAAADPYYIFTGWSDDLTGSNNPETITMDSDKTVTANFVFDGTVLLDDGFEGTVWNANWTGAWFRDDYPVQSGSYSASADRYRNGTFTSIDLDTSDASAVGIDFSFRKDDTEAGGDFQLYYYDGTNYDLIADLDTLGGDDVWLYYTDVITDSQYFKSNFQIRFSAALDRFENIWLDDVIITKAAPVGEPDIDPPAPNPMTWQTQPHATGTASISMTATTASDASGVEYYFECTAGPGSDSGWQDSPVYEDTGLEPDTTYTYTVTARDKSPNQNQTAPSTAESAATDPLPSDTEPPTPNPMTWETGSPMTSTESTSVLMVAATASDPSGVEYYFECISGGGNDSGWQDAPSYEDTALEPDTEYGYRVRARDKSPNQNQTDWSLPAYVTTGPPPDTTPPAPNPMTWEIEPFEDGSTSISMTATEALDPSGVEYYFACISGGGNDSGWQNNPAYKDIDLNPTTLYTYTVKARDKSPNQNQTEYSLPASATTAPAPKWTELIYDDFEAGWGNYNDGGYDCFLYTGGIMAHQGNRAAHIRDNSGINSSFYSTNGLDIDTPGYTQLKIEFWFYPQSMDRGKDFWLQYYDGSKWNTVAAYVSDTDFKNNVFYNKTVLLDEAEYIFPANMKIRFMCDAKNNPDNIYIDEIKVSVK